MEDRETEKRREQEGDDVENTESTSQLDRREGSYEPGIARPDTRRSGSADDVERDKRKENDNPE